MTAFDTIVRGVGTLSRLTGRGGGTTLPGRLLLKLDPGALSRLGSGLTDGSVLVSATNGKTTTSAMLAAILNSQGESLVANSAGSNMPWGITTALVDGAGSLGLFEVDEAWLPDVAAALDPKVILLGNLFRDQLDRYGETETLASRWRETASSSDAGTTWVLNADDPLVSEVGRPEPRGEVLYFGIEDLGVALPEAPHARDAKHCRECGATLEFAGIFSGHLGHWSCPDCGSSRPRPAIRATDIQLEGMSGLRARIETGPEEGLLVLPIPGLYNLYNALGAIAAATALGVGLSDCLEALSEMDAVFGRVERFRLEGRDLAVLLIKNPVGTNEVLRTLGLEDPPLDLWICLNDRIADGRDVSWIWDADFEVLAERVGTVTCAGTRASEMALRLKYAGWDASRIQVEGNVGASLESALERCSGSLFALPTYTALLELENYISASRGLERYWER
jgi:UDP-N-acetylmuramyl tripeptide synthase